MRKGDGAAVSVETERLVEPYKRFGENYWTQLVRLEKTADELKSDADGQCAKGFQRGAYDCSE